MAERILTGDTVVVISGEDEGKTGKVIRLFRRRRPGARPGSEPREAPYEADAAKPVGWHR